jgi:hypothetical protein
MEKYPAEPVTALAYSNENNLAHLLKKNALTPRQEIYERFRGSVQFVPFFRERYVLVQSGLLSKEEFSRNGTIEGTLDALLHVPCTQWEKLDTRNVYPETWKKLNHVINEEYKIKPKFSDNIVENTQVCGVFGGLVMMPLAIVTGYSPIGIGGIGIILASIFSMPFTISFDISSRLRQKRLFAIQQKGLAEGTIPTCDQLYENIEGYLGELSHTCTLLEERKEQPLKKMSQPMEQDLINVIRQEFPAYRQNLSTIYVRYAQMQEELSHL